MKYLGAYISPHKLDKNHQEVLLHKAIDKIDGWSSKGISQAGRATQISSVMNSLPIHSLTASLTNDCVIQKFQKLPRNYLWSSSKCKKGMHLISWKNVTTRKSCGGLGLKDIRIFKYSIHTSRILPFLNKEKILWSKCLFTKI
ncbi:ribonuclease H protein [Canna indica]|uniref:Ribonuclease H protein n=1 Tax=Canna indica TaxID=4628 RepID=A0AAQ3KR78_9LILI|nr:ribonuclease H protein [Canna indica]